MKRKKNRSVPSSALSGETPVAACHQINLINYGLLQTREGPSVAVCHSAKHNDTDEMEESISTMAELLARCRLQTKTNEASDRQPPALTEEEMTLFLKIPPKKEQKILYEDSKIEDLKKTIENRFANCLVDEWDEEIPPRFTEEELEETSVFREGGRPVPPCCNLPLLQNPLDKKHLPDDPRQLTDTQKRHMGRSISQNKAIEKKKKKEDEKIAQKRHRCRATPTFCPQLL